MKPIISKAIAANQYDIRNYLAKGERESQRRLDGLNEARSNRIVASHLGQLSVSVVDNDLENQPTFPGGHTPTIEPRSHIGSL